AARTVLHCRIRWCTADRRNLQNYRLAGAKIKGDVHFCLTELPRGVYFGDYQPRTVTVSLITRSDRALTAQSRLPTPLSPLPTPRCLTVTASDRIDELHKRY